MILHKLCEYYDRLANDPSQTIAKPGFAPQKISFAVVINKDGTLLDIHDVRDVSGKKPAPKILSLPFCGARTVGVKAMFLWDKAEYLLGWVSKELSEAPENESEAEQQKRQKKIDRIEQCFSATQQQHEKLGREINHPWLQALNKFFANWKPSLLSEKQLELLEEVGTGFGVFQLSDEKKFINESDELCDFWAGRSAENDDSNSQGTCLITGEESSLARLHPVVKGVPGAQAAGASIVSFNLNSFKSYGKEQSFNAPVSEIAAFKYTTALNRLLIRDGGRRLQVGDTTCVFWAESETEAEDLFNLGLDSQQGENEERAKAIANTFRKIAEGIADPPDAGVGFYVLGLSPNASRISVRFWIDGNVGTILRRIANHQKRLEIVRSEKDRELIPLWLLLAQTARESKEIQPLLGGALLRSVLTDSPYPLSLLSAIIRRIRAEREVRHVKAAMIKAILIRNYQKEISVMLDLNREETSYHLGRLFAALERCQEDASNREINATIKDRYFGAASSTPATVFPRLIRLNQHHISKLKDGFRIAAEKLIREIVDRVACFPTHLGLEDQGLFSIGYYHQRQDFFTKKTKEPTS